jgi:8-oxo-dGTP pyrophosphatase MutT (NUDIX family)
MLPKEKSCGVILVLRADDEDKFLILQQKPYGNWSFPKGHIEERETSIETAIRELNEETGINDIEFTNLPSIVDRYIVISDGVEKCDKTVELFIAFAKNDNVIPQEDEVMDYKWATFEEALETLNYIETKNVLKTAQKYLQDMIK